MCTHKWAQPQSRNVGYFIDLSLYVEALQLTTQQGNITASHLRQGLRQRLKGLLFVERQSQTVANDLVRELWEFGWLKRVENAVPAPEYVVYTLTPEGKEVLELSSQAIRRLLAVKMHARYVIPGWLIERLWRINPQSQGEVVLPSPLRNWRPKPRPWEQKEWTDDLAAQALEAAKQAQRVCPGAFPVEDEIWVQRVGKAWKHLGTWKQKGKADATGDKIRAFSPRGRLTMAMRTAAVELLFDTVPPGYQTPDIDSNKAPLFHRTFRVWCPRLADLELLFYTDRHPAIAGRLVFPTSVFRREASHPPFEELNDIQNPEGEFLWLYQPRWNSQERPFLQALVETHQVISRRVGTLYVSLLDVRDEVCRRLRLSALLFDEFIKRTFRESLNPNSRWSISLETDIREDQRSGSGLLRRPVWIDGVPYSLIAISETV